MDLNEVDAFDKVAQPARRELFRFGVALLFVIGVALFTWLTQGHVSLVMVVAAVIGAYMAMNIGANDVANNVGPAVGSKALTLGGAIAIAAIFEAAGAIIAGGDVVSTIKGGIIDPAAIGDPMTFVWLMMAALLAAAIWLNLATALGAPVSTTHSIVGGVMGGGIAAAGWGIANWGTVGQIAASWVISPLLGGLLAAVLLYLIKRSITYQGDLIEAAKKRVPWFLALMAWAFGTYLVVKGLKKIVEIPFLGAALIGLVIAAIVFFIVRPIVARAADGMQENNKASVNRLFILPLIFAAALLSFAHGSNDVANAVGPLAAINDALTQAGTASKAAIPLWVMLIGALGLAVGLALYGPKLIRTVGHEITDIDPMRAYCIAMAATLTVILASQLGLPVSTTHVTIGAVFGVGFLREYLKSNYDRLEQQVRDLHPESDDDEVMQEYLERFRAAPLKHKKVMLQELKDKDTRREAHISKRQRKGLKKIYKRELVKRSLLLKVIAAWVITVPAAALLAALFFFVIRALFAGG
ncbi:anion permease [Guyparkeria sp. SCN-R1]|uniref:inorganic phosphate transporter n=1 Tax=Guyparkeria sp. SCN-R1 TaxID=2341113 RepID=UPI000F652F14|nr:inorganic phosphate transporter [Guyparkeria sp. SCN-R1]RRQ24764.1 anion permease [Guyparkeria sp. SCN-R1]